MLKLGWKQKNTKKKEFVQAKNFEIINAVIEISNALANSGNFIVLIIIIVILLQLLRWFLL